MRSQGELAVSTHNESSPAWVHLYYWLSDNNVIKAAEVFQLIVSLHQLNYTFIIGNVINTLSMSLIMFTEGILKVYSRWWELIMSWNTWATLIWIYHLGNNKGVLELMKTYFELKDVRYLDNVFIT